MARMLGRYQTPGCCPGMREGWRRTRRAYGPDCSGGDTGTRWRKRVEQREFARSLLPEGEIAMSADGLKDCAHGCNGDCAVSGSEVCNFVCHPGPLHNEESTDEDVRAYVSRLWAEDWNSVEDAAYDHL